MSRRLISTIIATYNRPALVVRTLDNLLKQTYRPQEVVVIDDGSSPATRAAIEQWQAARHPDITLSYHWQRNQGPAAARNRGIEVSTGQLLHWLDDDDLMAPDALAELAQALDTTDPAIAMASYRSWTDGRAVGPLVAPRDMPTNLALKSMIQGTWFVPVHGYLFTRSAVDLIGPWNPVLASQEDDEYLLRAAMAGIRFVTAARAKVYYCQHDGPRRATPASAGEPVSHALEKRMRADLAIRESVFEALSHHTGLDRYYVAFSLWKMRLLKRYGGLVQPARAGSELLRWLALDSDGAQYSVWHPGGVASSDEVEASSSDAQSSG